MSGPVPNDTVSDVLTGFDLLWEPYFVKRYGPDWRTSRLGRHGKCAYCSGRIETDASRRMTAEVRAAGGKVGMKASCEE